MSPHPAALTRCACSLAAAFSLVACSPDKAGGPLAPTALALSVAPAALPFHGSVDASQTAVYSPATNSALVHTEGTGTALQLGRFTLVSDLALDLATLTGIAQTTLTAANGDVIIATVAAQGIPSANGLTLATLESATITGGTGRFAGVTGSYVLQRVIVHATNTSAGSFDGTISLAK